MSEEDTVCEMNIEPKSDTESMVTEMETSRKSSVVDGMTNNKSVIKEIGCFRKNFCSI